MKKLVLGIYQNAKRFLFCIALIAIFNLNARYRRVTSERTLDKRVSKNKFVIAMFYELNRKQRKDRKMRSKIEDQKRMFKQTSNRGLYRSSDTYFVSGNISKRDLENTVVGLKIKELPAFVLYHSGVVFKSKQDIPAVLTGFVSREQLMTFIDKNLEKDMRKYAKWRAKELRRREREHYWYYGPPYWYSYPYSGFGFGFGWGHPYYRRWGSWW